MWGKYTGNKHICANELHVLLLSKNSLAAKRRYCKSFSLDYNSRLAKSLLLYSEGVLNLEIMYKSISHIDVRKNQMVGSSSSPLSSTYYR